jgi:hypothetical protein
VPATPQTFEEAKAKAQAFADHTRVRTAVYATSMFGYGFAPAEDLQPGGVAESLTVVDFVQPSQPQAVPA